MELEIRKNRSNRKKIQTITGFISFLSGLIALAGLNAAMLLKTEDFPEVFLVQLPMLGLALGLIGVFTKSRSRMYAWWGVGLNTFILVFTFMMFGLAWSINAKP
ncbi:hypothetical protein V7087_11250 [Neobacillus niacini]|uniref:hypothetical protein n=1 Tax=Neobacillus niacini TaxID=86668 RepID=UPI002FFFB56D